MGNWWCTKCQSYRDSWAEHQSYRLEQDSHRDKRCYICDNSSLIYTDSQKARYKELVKERTSIPGYINEVERFSTWWNNNLATAVSCYDGYYRVFLLVYDKSYNTERPAVFPTDYSCNNWGNSNRGGRKKHAYFSDAKHEAVCVMADLSSCCNVDYPILLVHPDCDNLSPFDRFVGSSSSYVSEKSFYTDYFPSAIRPLDVIWVKSSRSGVDFWHVGVYLGNGEVCHYSRGDGRGKIEIGGWIGFADEGMRSIKVQHPLIPFRNYKKIAQNIAWVKNENFWYNQYELFNKNCEHLANMLVYGIKYSDQAKADQPFAYDIVSMMFSPIPLPFIYFNDGKNLTVKLSSEIDKISRELGTINNSRTEQIKTNYLQEVPPKECCRIM